MGGYGETVADGRENVVSETTTARRRCAMLTGVVPKELPQTGGARDRRKQGMELRT